MNRSKDIEKQTDNVIKAENRFCEKRDELVEAMKQRKILDRLKEKEWEDYRRESNRKEQLFMSEIAISAYNRKR